MSFESFREITTLFSQGDRSRLMVKLCLRDCLTNGLTLGACKQRCKKVFRGREKDQVPVRRGIRRAGKKER